MVSRPEFGRPAERHNGVSCYDIRRRPFHSRYQSWVGEGDPSLFDWQTGDQPHGDLRCVPLKERQEEGVPQLILYRLKSHSDAQGNALHKVPLLLEGLLQARICGLQKSTRHPSQGGHQVPPSLKLLPQPPRLIYLCPNKSPEVAPSCHDLKPVYPKEGLRPWYVTGRNN